MKIIEKDLTRLSTIRVPSCAKYFCEPRNLLELKKAIEYSQKNKLKYEVIGKGSNILFSKKSYNDRLFIKLAGEFSFLNIKNDHIEIGAAYSLKLAGKKLIELGYKDFIFFNLIPGTVGGSIAQNAGIGKHTEVRDVCQSVKVFDLANLEVVDLSNSDCLFEYRNSIVKKTPNRFIVLSGKFILKNKIDNKEKLIDLTKQSILEKSNREPVGFSFGSTFKNNDISAWECVKAVKHELNFDDDVFFSDKHNNWIINKNADGKKILMLIKKVKNEVKKKINVDLENEVTII
mgnify:FL=1